MDYFSSIWFKVGLSLFALLIAYGIFAYLMMDKLIRQTLDSPHDKRLKLVQGISKTMPIYRICFWILPLYLFLVPSIHSLNIQLSYSLITLLTFMYIALVEGFLVSKKLLKHIDK